MWKFGKQILTTQLQTGLGVHTHNSLSLHSKTTGWWKLNAQKFALSITKIKAYKRNKKFHNLGGKEAGPVWAGVAL